MKVHLINAPQKIGQESSGFEHLYPPLGLLYLASYARRELEDTDIKFTDGLLMGMEKTIDEVKRFRPDIVGVSYTTSACEGAYDFINAIKEIDSNILIVSGGPHPTAIPDEVMERSKTDICVIGEGEKTFLEILEGKDWEKISGIVWSKDGSIVHNPPREYIKNLDGIPFPARDLIEDWNLYKGYYLAKRKPDMVILSSRGCPYHCTFCSNPVWRVCKPSVRFRSPQNIVDELIELKERYGAREIFDETDDFNISKRQTLKVSQAIIDARLNLSFKFQIRANNMDEQLALQIKEMGTWLVFIGAESGNQETLDGVRKRITLKDIENTARLLSKQGIKVYGLFMLFNAWEEDGKLCFEGVKECEKTIDFAKLLLKRGHMHFMGSSMANPFPASPLWDIALKYNLIERPNDWLHWNDLWLFNLKLPGISDDDWKKVKMKAGRVQTIQALKSGQINFGTIQPLLRRGLKLIRWKLRI